MHGFNQHRTRERVLALWEGMCSNVYLFSLASEIQGILLHTNRYY